MSEGTDAARENASSTVPLADLTAFVQAALTGPANAGAASVVWSDKGAQILLHVDKLQLRAVQGAVIVAVDTESVELGVAPLAVRFVFGSDAATAGLLVAATDESALGNPQVAARWGALFRDVVWAALLRYVESHATAKGLVPGGVSVSEHGLTLTPQRAFSFVGLAAEHVEPLVRDDIRLVPASRTRTASTDQPG
ncbi:hypothetical protein ACPPVS_08920 [Cellulomonas sp. McL0617]|uniref:hypothetical protein n=1 Tax=Cellulomonas sp. McL0617 TaxID=3415675 RepID=UPI003CF97204